MSFLKPERGLASIWPQEFVHRGSLATLGMDVTAPFLLDMGLGIPGIERLREIVRRRIDQEPKVLAIFGLNQTEIAKWVDRLDDEFREHLPEVVRFRFWEWVRDTLTGAPADRPNWEMYEMFFFQWAVYMRDGEDTAGCFDNPRTVYDAYHAFIPGRRLADRIRESRSRGISTWDEKIFASYRYSLVEDEVNFETVFDPFAIVEATAHRNYFQSFWEHLLPRISTGEQERLLNAMRQHYDKDSRLSQLLPPASLSVSAR